MKISKRAATGIAGLALLVGGGVGVVATNVTLNSPTKTPAAASVTTTPTQAPSQTPQEPRTATRTPLPARSTTRAPEVRTVAPVRPSVTPKKTAAPANPRLGYSNGWLVRVGDRHISPPQAVSDLSLMPKKSWWNDCVLNNPRATCAARHNKKIDKAVSKAVDQAVEKAIRDAQEKASSSYCDSDSQGDCGGSAGLKDYDASKE